MADNEETIPEQTIDDLDNAIHNENNEQPAPVEEEQPKQPEIGISKKLKTRTDYINTIRDVCDKLNKEHPKHLHRKKLNELKQILATLTAEGVQQTQGIEAPPNNRDDYAVVLLYNLNKIALNLAENMSHSYRHTLGFECKDAVKKLEENEEQKQALKRAIENQVPQKTQMRGRVGEPGN